MSARLRPGLVRGAAVVALVAQIVFLLVWLIAPAWQGAGYSVLAHSISDMYAETAPAGLVLVVTFTLTGIATLLFTVLSVWPTFRAAGWTAVVGTILLGLSIFSLGDVLSPFERLACRLADPGCTAESQVANLGGTLDSLLSTVGFALFIAAGFFLAQSMTRTVGCKRWAWPTRVVAVVVLVLFIADGMAGPIGLAGLLERALAVVGAAAIGALAAGIIRRSSRER
ncbi:MAG: DUF998 domain-containing protein [Rhodoglobus sp.]